MAIIITEKPRELAPVGTHTGVLYQIIQVGTVFSQFYGTSSKKIDFSWELPDELMENSKPFSVRKRYTESLGKKAVLAADLTSWLGQTPGKNFVINDLLGKACNLSIIHETGMDGVVREKITAISPLKKGEKAPKPTNPTKIFEFDPFNQEVFNSLPEFYQDMIRATPEYQAAIQPKEVKIREAVDQLEDEIPF